MILWVTGLSHLISTSNRPIQPIKSNATLTFQVFGLAVRIKESKDSSQTKTFPNAAGIGAGVGLNGLRLVPPTISDQA